MRRFRHLRRLTAVAAQLLLLQLAFVNAVGACPLEPSGAHAAAGAHMAGADASHAQHVADASGPTERAPVSSDSHRHDGGHCNVACVPASCSSAGHCASSATSVNDATSWPLVAAHDAASRTTDAAPRSVSTAPEPPPPRG